MIETFTLIHGQQQRMLYGIFCPGNLAQALIAFGTKSSGAIPGQAHRIPEASSYCWHNVSTIDFLSLGQTWVEGLCCRIYEDAYVHLCDTFKWRY